MLPVPVVLPAVLPARGKYSTFAHDEMLYEVIRVMSKLSEGLCAFVSSRLGGGTGFVHLSWRLLRLIGIGLRGTYLMSCLTRLLNVLETSQNLLCELSVG